MCLAVGFSDLWRAVLDSRLLLRCLDFSFEDWVVCGLNCLSCYVV